jgi:hypothetical protein
MYFAYIIESTETSLWYYGSTSDPNQRICFIIGCDVLDAHILTVGGK